jgi:hypothetical protein
MTILTGPGEMKKEEMLDPVHLISRLIVAPVLLRTCEWIIEIIEVLLKNLEVEVEANLVDLWMETLNKP